MEFLSECHKAELIAQWCDLHNEEHHKCATCGKFCYPEWVEEDIVDDGIRADQIDNHRWSVANVVIKTFN